MHAALAMPKQVLAAPPRVDKLAQGQMAARLKTRLAMYLEGRH